jgi:hypothetical protein
MDITIPFQISSGDVSRYAGAVPYSELLVHRVVGGFKKLDAIVMVSM